MDRYYKERFHAQKNLIQKIAPLMEANKIIEKLREELRSIIPKAMEVCILQTAVGNHTGKNSYK